jgi:hypothetical protein
MFILTRLVFRSCAAAYAAACAARAAGADGLSIVIAALDVLEEDWTFDAGAALPPLPPFSPAIAIAFTNGLPT